MDKNSKIKIKLARTVSDKSPLNWPIIIGRRFPHSNYEIHKNNSTYSVKYSIFIPNEVKMSFIFKLIMRTNNRANHYKEDESERLKEEYPSLSQLLSTDTDIK